MIDRDKDNEERKKKGLKKLLSSYEGREALHDILSSCHVYSDIFGESAEVNRKLGARNIGLKLMADLVEADEDSYITLTLEARSRSKLDERARDDKRAEYAERRRTFDQLFGTDPGNERDSAGKHDSGSGLPNFDGANTVRL